MTIQRVEQPWLDGHKKGKFTLQKIALVKVLDFLFRVALSENKGMRGTLSSI